MNYQSWTSFSPQTKIPPSTKQGSRPEKRVNRATEKRWIGVAGGLTHRNRHTLICRHGPFPRLTTSPKFQGSGDSRRHSKKPEFCILLIRSRLRQEFRAIYRADSALP